MVGDRSRVPLQFARFRRARLPVDERPRDATATGPWSRRVHAWVLRAGGEEEEEEEEEEDKRGERSCTAFRSRIRDVAGQERL